jgi:nucleotide-binding universal stress UspA family protein
MKPTVESYHEPAGAGSAPVFPSILCGIDGTRSSYEAARQAALLAGDGAALTYLAVTWEVGYGPTAVALLSRRHAADALARARDVARELGIVPELVEVEGEYAALRLTEEARGHDLLAIGIHSRSRAGGILVGTAASTVIHRSPVPVLLARRPRGGDDVPASILLAVDGTPASRAAAELTARLAHRHESRVAIIAPQDHDAGLRHELAAEAAELLAATGREPLILDEHGPAHTCVPLAAADLGASLVVLGSRGLTGVKALRSASERIAHAAPCSVLVVRRPDETA